jgi:hypothetical protein
LVCLALPCSNELVPVLINHRQIAPDLLRSITDPEHPLTLEQLAVVSASQIKVSNKKGHERVLIEFTPTIPHCSMATLIGKSSPFYSGNMVSLCIPSTNRNCPC